MELERDDVFEGRINSPGNDGTGWPESCAWCGNWMYGAVAGCFFRFGHRDEKRYATMRFCNRDHATKWNDDRRRQFPGRQEEAPDA